MSDFKELCKKLENKIKASYEEGTSMEEAEKLAAEFLYAQMVTSSELKKVGLDSRMKKTGLKSIRAAVYLAEVQKSDKKPSDTLLEQIVNTDETVNQQQDLFDTAEIESYELERYYNIFVNGHIYYRSLAKGTFGG